MSGLNRQFAVNFWGSKPGTNDDCWNGADFDTLAEALAIFDAPVADLSTAFVELDGPGVHKERKNPDFTPSDLDDGEWQREIEREHLMLHGLAGLGDLS